MSKIEKIEMQGFKSFSKKTVVAFPDNFSVVCGPNGSGKSNILDSIAFVLGRSSAKSMRAGRLTELIFNGAKSKKPSEFAKVSIYFDNKKREIPIQEDTVVISRTINRKGISIYKLNGRTVTREKIIEVLRHINVQPDGYNIIMQGDVTELIEMSPLERKEIINEISGISEYDEKKAKAQRELLTVEERLKETSIVITERSKLLERLEKESKAAEQYSSLSAELDKLRASLASKKLAEANDAMKHLEEKINEKEQILKEIDSEFNLAEKELEEKEKQIKEMEKELFDRTKDVALIREVEKLKSEIATKRTKIEFAKDEEQRLDGIIDKLKNIMNRSVSSQAVNEILNAGITGVYGTVTSLMNVPVEYQTAIEVACGNHKSSIIVKDDNTAIECIRLLKMKKSGRATFLPLNKIRPKSCSVPKKPGVIDVAVNLVEFDKKYENAFSFVLGDTIITDNINTAKNLERGRYVSLDGDMIERSGVMVGGFYAKKQKTFEINEIKKYNERKKQLRETIDALSNEIIEIEKNLKELQSEETEGSEKLKETENKRNKLNSEFEAIKQKRKKLFEKKAVLQNDINRLRIQKARLEAELENIKLEFSECKKVETYDIDVEALEAKIKEVSSQIHALGPINMKAVEEYKELKVVFDELKQKVEKLIAERDKIVELITEIEDKRKQTFMETLYKVSEQFKQVYNDLTGGAAELRLEEDNIESGLLIEASPAGKKLLNIDSMSGGEKTLVALAFLFALQRFKPAPFYILDEIEAALDKTNTKKIVELIKKYSENSQFIVITHNDLTIRSADCVYGVSMDNGESRLLGIKMPN